MEAVLLLLAVLLASAIPSGADPRVLLYKHEIGLWGDLPYGEVQATTGMPNLIRDINSFNLAFTVHDGDIKAGSSSCANPVFEQFLGYLKQLRAPAMFTPGDNEWTDCDRNNAGAFNNRERLDYIRSVFFSTSRSQGGIRTMKQIVQTDELCLSASNTKVPCSENRRWNHVGVTYITVNVPGSCNNLCDTNPDPEEFNARNAANIKWLKEGFAAAKSDNSVAVMIISQANPGFDETDPTRAPLRNARNLTEVDAFPDGFKDWLETVRSEVLAFNKPVAYVHGDSHYARIDKPLLTSTGARITSFTRVETPGDHAENANNDVNWLKVTVDPNSREVFSYTFMDVPGN